VVSFQLLGRDVVLFLGNEAHRAFYEAPEEVLNAAKVPNSGKPSENFRRKFIPNIGICVYETDLWSRSRLRCPRLEIPKLPKVRFRYLSLMFFQKPFFFVSVFDGLKIIIIIII
jgi:hypothetical protein